MDIKKYRKNNKNVLQLLQLQDSTLGRSDFERYCGLAEKQQNIKKYKSERWEYIKDNLLEDWQKDFVENLILDDEVIEKNRNRKGFSPDRKFTYDGFTYEDDILTLFMLIYSQIMEEKYTIAFWNISGNMIGKLESNPKASKINSTDCVNSEPDFILKINNNEYPVELKCVQKSDFEICLRKGQYEKFKNELNNTIIIVRQICTNIDNKKDYRNDYYYFYRFAEIEKYFRKEERYGRVKYIATRKELEKNGIDGHKTADIYETPKIPF